MSGIPSVTAHTQTEIEDSCNCCWGRKKKPKHEKDLTPSEEAFVDKISNPKHTNEIRDINDIINISINLESPTRQRRRSDGHHHSHDPEKQPEADKSIRSPDKDSKTQ